jgi:HEAT repeat protein
VDAKELAALVAKFPVPAQKDGKLAEVDKQATDQALAELSRGGREAVIGLVDLIAQADPTANRASHALHALCTYVRGKDESQRQTVAEALASTLGSHSKDVQGFVVRQLQLVGGREAAVPLGKLLLDEALSEYAAQALLAIKDGAAEQFRAALPQASGARRLTIVQALGVLRDASAAEMLRKLVTDPDRDTRLVAVWALASAGDAGAAELLLKAADAQGFERTKATQACLLLADNLLAAGRKKEAVRIYSHLRDTRTDPGERFIREAAERGLAKAG